MLYCSCWALQPASFRVVGASPISLTDRRAISHGSGRGAPPPSRFSGRKVDRQNRTPAWQICRYSTTGSCNNRRKRPKDFSGVRNRDVIKWSNSSVSIVFGLLVCTCIHDTLTMWVGRWFLRLPPPRADADCIGVTQPTRTSFSSASGPRFGNKIIRNTAVC